MLLPVQFSFKRFQPLYRAQIRINTALFADKTYAYEVILIKGFL